jgi:hypothetical protein
VKKYKDDTVNLTQKWIELLPEGPDWRWNALLPDLDKNQPGMKPMKESVLLYSPFSQKIETLLKNLSRLVRTTKHYEVHAVLCELRLY